MPVQGQDAHVSEQQGRPTKYKPEYDALIVQRAREGGCFTEFAAEIGVTRQTLHNWKQQFPSFLDAYTQAEQEGEAYWAKKLRTELMLDNKANAPLVKLYLANRFKWSDRIVQENVGEGGGPQKHVVTHELSPEVRELLAAATAGLTDGVDEA